MTCFDINGFQRAERKSLYDSGKTKMKKIQKRLKIWHKYLRIKFSIMTQKYYLENFHNELPFNNWNPIMD